jgi:hypothetical protein
MIFLFCVAIQIVKKFQKSLPAFSKPGNQFAGGIEVFQEGLPMREVSVEKVVNQLEGASEFTAEEANQAALLAA